MRVAHRGIVHNRQGVVGGSHGLSSRPKVVFSKTKRAVAGLGMAVHLKNGELSVVTGRNSRPLVSHSRIQTFVHLGPQGPQDLENGTTTLGMISWRVVACQEWAQVEGAISSQALVARSTPLTSGRTFLSLRCVLITSGLEKFGQASCSHSSHHAGHLLLLGIQAFLRWARLVLVDPHHPLRPFWHHRA